MPGRRFCCRWSSPAALAVAAGCGGGTKTYSAPTTQACLCRRPAWSSLPCLKQDFIASTAEGGAFTARFRDNNVIVSFGLDRDGAEHIVRGYQRFRGKNIGLRTSSARRGTR